MRHRTLDEMISYFNQQVSEMDINQSYKIQLLGMVTAIAYSVQKPQWIPVNERLPENDDIVLITMDNSITVRGEFIEQLSNELGFFKDGVWHWAYESGQDYWPETTHVTAWMPLPEPYKEKKQ